MQPDTEGARLVDVLVCGNDDRLSGLLALNLSRRGFEVRQARWAPCCGAAEQAPAPAGVIILDLDCPEPGAWRGARRARLLFPDQVLVLLGYEWPDFARLDALRPCGYVRKPISIGDLLRAIRELTPAAHR
jgi:DNA-binding response OmpR family regulator